MEVIVIGVMAVTAYLLYRFCAWAVRPITSGELARQREYLRYVKAEQRDTQEAHLAQLKEKHGDL